MTRPLRIGLGGPVGSGKTALIEALVPRLVAHGHAVGVVTNDIYSTEDAQRLEWSLTSTLDASHLVGVQTGCCPHTAVREDPSANLAALTELEKRVPQLTIELIESGGDNLTLTFSPGLVDRSVFVIDVAAGDDIPAKGGPGVTRSGLLVINKVDLASAVGANLARMDRDARAARGERPVTFADCRRGVGLKQITAFVQPEPRPVG